MTVQATQISSSAVPNYLHYAPAIPEMIALGRNAPIVLANQLVINDRLRPDRYIVKDITGLRGPDLRDSRQPRPAAHGEVLFDAYWGGKLLDDETPIPTPFGWKLMKELNVGDSIFDDTGHHCNVTGVFPQPEPRCYELHFSDGSKIVAGADHLWETVDFETRIRHQRAYLPRPNNRRRSATSKYRGVHKDANGWLAYYGEGRGKKPIGYFETERAAANVALGHRLRQLEDSGWRPQIRTTEEIKATLRTSFAPSRPDGVSNHAVRVAGALQYPEKDLPISPYVLGAWLGDGTSAAAEITTADPEVLDHIRFAGHPIRPRSDDRNLKFGICNLYRELRLLGLLKNKHIPVAYLQGSIAQRRELMAGMLDTDGTVGEKGSIEFDSTKLTLAKGFLELARSLGYRPTFIEKRAKLNGEDYGAYFHVQFVTEDQVFRIGRKREAHRKRRAGIRYPEQEQYRYIIDVVPVETRPMRCISVDSPSHLYLCGEAMIPTHNTITMAGTMEGGSTAELNAMERDLVAVLGSPPTIGLATSQTQAALEVFEALESMTEFPIKFNWWDQRDAFFDVQSTVFWSQLSGSSLSISGNGRCVSFNGGATVSYHNLRSGFIDAQVTACVSLQPPTATQSIGVIAKATSSTSYIQAILQWQSANTWELILQMVTASGATTLAQVALNPQITSPTSVWIQLQTIDDTLTATVYSQDPHVVTSPTTLATCSVTLMGTNAQTFGYHQTGFVGLMATQLNGRWSFLDWRVDAIYPCDFVINGRTVQSPAVSHVARPTEDGTRLKRDFQFAVRASDPRILCPVSITSTVPLVSANNVAFGRTYPRTYPLTYNVPTVLPSNQPLIQTSLGTPQEVVVKNRGTWVARPIVTIYGGITNPVLANLTTGRTFALDGTIASGDFVQIDAYNHTMTNRSGSSVMSMFDTGNTRWPEIAPGENILQLTGSSPVGTPSAQVAWNSAWI